MYRIGEFSKMVKLTVKALRFYEEAGLLKPAYIDRFTGYRYYSTAELYPVQQIVALRQAGFSISEIKYVMSGNDVSELLEMKEAELKRDIGLAEEALLKLSSIKKYYSEEQKMNYQAIVKELPEYTVYYKRFKVSGFADYGSAIPAVGAEIAAANPDLKCIEPNYNYIAYIDGEYKEKDFNVEYAEAVEKAGKETADIKFKVLPKTTVACVMHKGSYSHINKAYAYLLNWIEDNGYCIADNFREQYIDGCWNMESEEDYLTEIQIPVIKK